MADMSRCVSDVPGHFVFASFLAKCTVTTSRQFFVSPVKFLKLHPSTLCTNLPFSFIHTVGLTPSNGGDKEQALLLLESVGQ